MRVLMLGWEFPPYISGGLGTACYGLTKALDAAGHEVLFVLPRPVAKARPLDDDLSPLNMVSSHGRTRIIAPVGVGDVYGTHRSSTETLTAGPVADGAIGSDTFTARPGFDHASFLEVPASFSSPYPDFEPLSEKTTRQITNFLEQSDPNAFDTLENSPGKGAAALLPNPVQDEHGGHYGYDLIGDAERYGRLVVALTRNTEFDVIHAHDWLTFHAAMMVSTITRKPFVAHIHSTEFDRAGNNANTRIIDAERAGLLAAQKVIAVSQQTKAQIVRRYGVPPNRVEVIYNGIDLDDTGHHDVPDANRFAQERTQGTKYVLFLGRITWQKGPEYFIQAARKVIDLYPNVNFVLAGSGDMSLRMIDLANALKIGNRVLFTGFLNKEQVARIFSLADCYVMPSVSEPFGIAALEALSHRVPVILSKTSGAGEVLQNVLKVDFWDVDDIANKILAVLRLPPLAQTLREQSAEELQQLTWTAAASRCSTIYSSMA